MLEQRTKVPKRTERFDLVATIATRISHTAVHWGLCAESPWLIWLDYIVLSCSSAVNLQKNDSLVLFLYHFVTSPFCMSTGFCDNKKQTHDRPVRSVSLDHILICTQRYFCPSKLMSNADTIHRHATDPNAHLQIFLPSHQRNNAHVCSGDTWCYTTNGYASLEKDIFTISQNHFAMKIDWWQQTNPENNVLCGGNTSWSSVLRNVTVEQFAHAEEIIQAALVLLY